MIISWGKPTLKIKKLETGATEYTFPTPVDGSTQLSSEKGDKMEALIEGGEPEAVKYKRGKYSLEFQIRLGNDNAHTPTSSTGGTLLDGEDGVVAGEYELELVPEDVAEGAPGFKMPRGVFSYTDSYTSNDDIIRTYTIDSLKPATGGQIVWTFQ